MRITVLQRQTCSLALVGFMFVPLGLRAQTASDKAASQAFSQPGDLLSSTAKADTAGLPDSPSAIVSNAPTNALRISDADLRNEYALHASLLTQPSQSPQSQSSQSETSQSQSSQTQQSQPPPRQKPVGTAVAESPNSTGIAASEPAGMAVAPAKQRRVRIIILRTGAIIGAGVALGTIVALTAATPSKPPGAH